MGFDPGADRREISGMTDAGFRTSAPQVDEHLHVALLEGGDFYLAWTTLGALDLLASPKCRPCGLRAGTDPNELGFAS